MNKYLAPILLVLVIILIASLGYFIFQNQQLIGQLQQPPTSPPATSTPASSPTPEPSPSPTTTIQGLQENIKDAINSANTAALEGYMANPVSVILQATECCGPQTPEEALSNLSYISDGIPFNFNQEDATVKNLKTKNNELADQFIGISQAREHLIAFGINSQNRIESIRMSVSWKLFSY